MNKKFVFHGAYLLIVGIVAVMYNPHTGVFGFNSDAKSGLIVSGAFAIISFFWAFYYRQAHRAAIVGGFITTILLFAGTIPRAFGAWREYASGDTVKWYAGTTITLVIIGSIPLFVSLARSLRSVSRSYAKK
jgi:hypothetical protein